jgi:hypothetical protein
MRYLLLALMITLLPVRGWVGNAMAVDMAVQQTLQAQAEGKALPAMPDDCPMHAGATAETATDPLTAGHCNDCDTCELCLALASFAGSVGALASSTPSADPPPAGHLFSSAEGSTHLKPPIS